MYEYNSISIPFSTHCNNAPQLTYDQRPGHRWYRVVKTVHIVCDSVETLTKQERCTEEDNGMGFQTSGIYRKLISRKRDKTTVRTKEKEKEKEDGNLAFESVSPTVKNWHQMSYF